MAMLKKSEKENERCRQIYLKEIEGLKQVIYSLKNGNEFNSPKLKKQKLASFDQGETKGEGSWKKMK